MVDLWERKVLAFKCTKCKKMSPTVKVWVPLGSDAYARHDTPFPKGWRCERSGGWGKFDGIREHVYCGDCPLTEGAEIVMGVVPS